MINRSCVMIFSSLWCFAAGSWAAADDVYSKRFDPPRVYFTHANLNKGGLASAIRGQDNPLSLYFTAVDKTAGQYTPDGFSYVVRLPVWVRVLDQKEGGLTVSEDESGGTSWQRVSKKLDPVAVKARLFRGSWGIAEQVWLRVDDAPASAKPQPIEVSLFYKGRLCYTSTARLRVYDELTVPPRVSPSHFKFWLHYGPHRREGRYDELAAYLRKAGINTVQIMASHNTEYPAAMKKRGFYVIAQRGGSYSRVYQQMHACLTRGPAWFEESDDGHMQATLPFADGVLWDFEPAPAHIDMDPWVIAQFSKAHRLPAGLTLTEKLIKTRYLKPWIEFRQKQFATVVSHWADFCRSIDPKIETILTEGRADVFDPPGQIDYVKVAGHVTYCDPMNFAGLSGVHGVRQWMTHAKDARFTGCQNVAASSHHSVFISARTIMLQIVSAALIGCKGTSIYPGPAMDAENFVLFNRVMGFLGTHSHLVFQGRADPATVILTPLPRDDVEIDLGNGQTIHNIYPDWNREAIHRAFHNKETNEYLAVLVNWNASEPCYVKLCVSATGGQWMIVDDEKQEVFTAAGRTEIPASMLVKGLHLVVPPNDYRGFRVAPHKRDVLAGYRRVGLETIGKKYLAYAKPKPKPLAGAAQSGGAIRLGFDDFNRDNQFEYLVESAGQKVWISQQGTILKWRVNDRELRTKEHGLCRDMIWLPQVERADPGMDAAMTLEDKKVSADRVELTFGKSVSLSATGELVSVKLVKTLIIHAAPGRVKVSVRVRNTSLAMDRPTLDFSYRVHNYIDYLEVGPRDVWVDDGSRLVRFDAARDYSIANTGLTLAESGKVFAEYKVVGPHRLAAYGEHFRSQNVLLSCVPLQPKALLQVLRWHSRNGKQGSIEWMYRPRPLRQGDEAVYEYQLRVETGVQNLGGGASRLVAESKQTDAGLLLHLDFDDRTDAVVAKGNGKATVKGTPVFEKTPTGKGLLISGGTELAYHPAGNVNLAKGKIYVRFKPFWHGADRKPHYILRVRPKSGLVYFGKLADGRLLMNMLGRNNKQHYAWHLISKMEKGTWHEVTQTWDTTAGTMTLYLDGKKVADYRGEPWQMGRLPAGRPDGRLVIPGDAEMVIDELKIWDRP